MRRMSFAEFVQAFFQNASVIITVTIAILICRQIGPLVIPNSMTVWLWMGGKGNVFAYIFASAVGTIETIGILAFDCLLIRTPYVIIGKGFAWIRSRAIWDRIRYI